MLITKIQPATETGQVNDLERTIKPTTLTHFTGGFDP